MALMIVLMFAATVFVLFAAALARDEVRERRLFAAELDRIGRMVAHDEFWCSFDGYACLACTGEAEAAQ